MLDQMIKENGATVLQNLDQVAGYLNNYKN